MENVAPAHLGKPSLTYAARSWQLLPHDPAAIRRLSESVRVAPLVAQLLCNRGLTDPDAARHFLAAPYQGLRKPEELPGVVEAADRLYSAVLRKDRICVYGDYDVDGLTGTAILHETLRLLGATVDFHVPHRLEEGYGLSVEALRQIAQSGAAVVVTVDCGITSVAEAAEAKRLGVELIITDHHEPKDELPDAAAIVHPRLPGTAYPFGGLSGSAVAFKLAWALCQRASGATKVSPQFREFLLDSVTLAALGMIADVVPLQDENRIFVRHGLRRLKETNCIGLRALLAAAGLDNKLPTATDVSFYLAPRLNAAGRLGCARLVVDLFTTTSTERAKDLARFLNNQNEERQKIERRIVTQARERIESTDSEALPAFVLSDDGWHAGVIGIVAGRLAARYCRPAVLISIKGGMSLAVGSGRSVEGFALHEALQACNDLLVSHGGHAAAAGFKIDPARIPEFRERFCAYAAERLAAAPPSQRMVVDAEVPLSSLTIGVLESLEQLEPHGAGNPKPLLLAGAVQVIGQPRLVGQGERHVSFRVRQGGTTVRAIAFNFADRVQEMMSTEGYCNLLFTPSINEWQGYRSVQMEIKDMQPGKKALLSI